VRLAPRRYPRRQGASALKSITPELGSAGRGLAVLSRWR